MANTLDVRGLSCPLPLLRTQAALADSSVRILAAEPGVKEKIIKYARSQKLHVE
ncbi:sulfurtransferase TusA family protein [Sporomusa termitida]|uniref:Sulfurtransferase TusA n=1 Tax=Sporomusa termitida TaxID=2377 RepID=A0A517DVV5_9FIRM|nr:sulfurtransferase TusA family protein [Sporomusa termitida]QDR81406.1 Sulfurtransferase TusA [Sporomusa termitida]